VFAAFLKQLNVLFCTSFSVDKGTAWFKSNQARTQHEEHMFGPCSGDI